MYEGSVCVCCMSTEDLVDLFVEYTDNNTKENYAKMLATCLNIQVFFYHQDIVSLRYSLRLWTPAPMATRAPLMASRVTKWRDVLWHQLTFPKFPKAFPATLELCGMTLSANFLKSDGHDSICRNCVCKLRDCITFKKQALRSVSILSSVDISQLLSHEDMQILGIKQNELETKSTVKEKVLRIILTPIDEFICKRSKLEDEEATVAPFHRTKTRTKKRGRPRTRPLDEIPYELKKDELVCRECGQEFGSNIALRAHLNTHFGRHTCDTCSKKFMTYQSLVDHQACHLQGPFPCATCDQVFNSIHTLKSHRRFKHRSTLPFTCKMCGEGFTTVQRRLRHLSEVHGNNEANYICKYCDKRFRHSSELSKHKSQHFGVQCFACPVCGVRYRRETLRNHLKTHSKTHLKTRVTAKATSGLERRFVCKLCSKAFGQKITLKYHIGTHIRKGEYTGAPENLIVDKLHARNHAGLLSDIEEHSDENEEHLGKNNKNYSDKSNKERLEKNTDEHSEEIHNEHSEEINNENSEEINNENSEGNNKEHVDENTESQKASSVRYDTIASEDIPDDIDIIDEMYDETLFDEEYVAQADGNYV